MFPYEEILSFPADRVEHLVAVDIDQCPELLEVLFLKNVFVFGEEK